MPISDAENLARSRRGSVVAPAGCGKTHLIAEAVSRFATGKELILTHTHAGVAALKHKLSSFGVPSKLYQVDTIAGWALRFSAHFPELSGLSTTTPTGEDWNQTYRAATKLLKGSPVREIVGYSYSGIYVDEYQDCILEQHELILELSKLVPCRVLGDPLQGIFGFAGETVDWGRDVSPNFDCLPELNTPWRWNGKNEELGSWLRKARDALIKGEPISLEGTPVRWVEAPRGKLPLVQMQICHETASVFEGSVVAIHKWPRDCHAVASRLKGRYFVIEAIDCKDLMEGADGIGQNIGPSRAYNLYQFTSKCMTKVGSELRASCQPFFEGRATAGRKASCTEQVDSLQRVAMDDSIGAVSEALSAIRRLPGARIYRKELFDEMVRAVEEYETGDYESLRDAAWAVRNRTRHIGRRLSRGTVGTTLLIKGLEFEHAIVLDADKLDAPNLYVAMTRGAQSLTIISKQPLLSPK